MKKSKLFHKQRHLIRRPSSNNLEPTDTTSNRKLSQLFLRTPILTPLQQSLPGDDPNIDQLALEEENNMNLFLRRAKKLGTELALQEQFSSPTNKHRRRKKKLDSTMYLRAVE